MTNDKPVDPLSLAAALTDLVGRLVRMAEQPPAVGSYVRGSVPEAVSAAIAAAQAAEPLTYRPAKNGPPLAPHGLQSSIAATIPDRAESIVEPEPTIPAANGEAKPKRGRKPKPAEPAPLPKLTPLGEARAAERVDSHLAEIAARNGLVELERSEPDPNWHVPTELCEDDEPTGDLNVAQALADSLEKHDAKVADEAEAKRARKRESDRKYAAKRKAARDLARAIGNPVEGLAEPPPVSAGREPVILGPTAPAESFAPEPDSASVMAPTPEGFTRAWAVYRGNGGADSFLGEVFGVGETEARRAAFRIAGDQHFTILPKMIHGGKGQAIVRITAPDPPVEVETVEAAASKRSKTEPVSVSDAVASHKERLASAMKEAGVKTDAPDDIFIYWSGRNPVYAIRAPSLKAAIDWAKTQHPKDARFDVRLDTEDVFRSRALFLQIDLKAKPADQIDRLRGDESERRWNVFDLRATPPLFLGDVAGSNSTRAVMAAEAKWPDVPNRMIRIESFGRESRANGRKREAVS
jgi:hypothetical protein